MHVFGQWTQVARCIGPNCYLHAIVLRSVPPRATSKLKNPSNLVIRSTSNVKLN